MKQLFKKIFLSLAIVFSVAGTATILSPAPTYADNATSVTGTSTSSNSTSTSTSDLGFSCRYFLGMTSWDCGLQASGGLGAIDSEDDLKQAIVIIIANVLTDLTIVAAYLVLAFVIYGGYLYIFSSGEAGKVEKGKKTILHAFIGLGIVTLSNVALNAIRFALLSSSATFQDCHDAAGNITMCIEPTSVITNAIQWIIGTAGVIALVFVVIGGIGYITSAGDSNKLQKAKNTIVYALIGLVIVAISEILVSFVAGIYNDADPYTGYYNNTIISKEYHETTIN